MSLDAPNTKAPAPKAAAPISSTVKMLLHKNYVPRNLVRIIGYQREARSLKDAAGRPIIVEPAQFIEGEMKPHQYPGVGYDSKIWAGTVIEVPEDEGRDIRQKRIGEVYI